MSLIIPGMDLDSLQQSNSVYESDEFRLFCHKILPCSKRTAHDWASCPFAHPGEKAKRRNIRTHQYDCEMCEAVAKGEECKLGSNCPHAHNVFESWLHPQKYRTMMCKDRDKCTRPVCFFAHGPHELRTPAGVAPLQSDTSQTASALPAIALEHKNSQAVIASATAAAGNGISNWGVQPQQPLVHNLAGQLARGTSNASVMSRMGASGPSTPTTNTPAGMGSASVMSGALEMSSVQLLANLTQTGNAAVKPQDASAQQVQQQQQQQFRAMEVAAGAASALPGLPTSSSRLNVSQPMGSGFSTVLQLPMQMMMSPQQQQQQQASAELLRQSSAAAGGLVTGMHAGYASMECSDASSANLSDLSATLSLLSSEQVAQMLGTGVPLHADNVGNSGPLVWPPQLASSISGSLPYGMPAQSRLQMTDTAGMACHPMGMTAGGNLVTVFGSSQGVVAMQQPQQQMMGSWLRSTPAPSMLHARPTYMVAGHQQAQMQQHQQVFLPGTSMQGGTLASSQATTCAMPYYLN